MPAKFTTNKLPAPPRKSEVELTLLACRHYLRKTATDQSKLISRITGAIELAKFQAALEFAIRP
jgi:hypothetical protein